jgi:hypothetical protein
MENFKKEKRRERVLIRVITDDADALNAAIERMRIKAFDDVSKLEIEGKLAESKDALILARAFENFTFVHDELYDLASSMREAADALEEI